MLLLWPTARHPEELISSCITCMKPQGCHLGQEHFVFLFPGGQMGFEKNKPYELPDAVPQHLDTKTRQEWPCCCPLLSEGVSVLTFTSTPFSSLLSGSDFSSQWQYVILLSSPPDSDSFFFQFFHPDLELPAGGFADFSSSSLSEVSSSVLAILASGSFLS